MVLTAAEFGQLLSVVGEPVTFRRAKAPGASITVQAIVQDTSKAAEPIVNAYGVSGRSVQFYVAGVAPEKFDRITRANGEELVFDVVNPQAQRGNGLVSYYVAYAKGK